MAQLNMIFAPQPAICQSPTYLIVMSEVLVAQDLALTVSDHDPGARVIVVKTLVEAEAALAAEQRPVVAFLNARPDQFAGSALAARMAKSGGQVILLGEAAEAAGPTPQWDVLHQPFSTEIVMTHLCRC